MEDDKDRLKIPGIYARQIKSNKFIGNFCILRSKMPHPVIKSGMTEETIFDCIVVGAGPGGLQASIYLGRFNRKVLLIDRSGGRTWHARRIENFISHKAIAGRELISTGIEQAESFNVRIIKGLVTRILKNEMFEVYTDAHMYLSRYVIVSSGASDNLPPIENIHRFLGEGFYTCIDCDGYKTSGKKLVVLGNSLMSVHLALAMKEMYTDDVSLILYSLLVPRPYVDELSENRVRLVDSVPVRLLGQDRLEGIELKDGRKIECEAIMSHFGYRLNDDFLSRLDLKRDAQKNKYLTNRQYESSCDGLYIVGPLAGNDQAIIAAGEGAMAALDLKKRLLDR